MVQLLTARLLGFCGLLSKLHWLLQLQMILASGDCLVDIFVTLEVGTAQQIKAKHGSCHELMLAIASWDRGAARVEQVEVRYKDQLKGFKAEPNDMFRCACRSVLVMIQAYMVWVWSLILFAWLGNYEFDLHIDDIFHFLHPLCVYSASRFQEALNNLMFRNPSDIGRFSQPCNGASWCCKRLSFLFLF